MAYADLRAQSVETVEKLAPALLDSLAAAFGWKQRPISMRDRRHAKARLRRGFFGMRGYLLGLELLAQRLPPAGANYALLEGLTREYARMLGKKLRDNDNACSILLEQLEDLATPSQTNLRLPGYIKARSTVDALVSHLSPHVQEEQVATVANAWFESDDARKVIQFGQRLPTLARGWRGVEPKRLTQRLVVRLTNQYRDCAVVFEQCLRRFVALDRAARGVPVSWARFEHTMLAKLEVMGRESEASTHLGTLMRGIDRNVRNVLAHGHATVNLTKGVVELRNQGHVVVAWTPAEFFRATWTLTAHVVAMLKFDEQLNLCGYREMLRRLVAAVRTEQPSPGWWTPQRAQIHEWLARHSEALAELYSGAVRLLDGPSDVSSRWRFIAHAVREIRNRLPDAVAPGERKRLRYEDWVERIRLSLGDFSWGPTVDGRALPHASQDLLRQLLDEHSAVAETNIDAAHRLFRSAARSGRGDFLRPLAREWHEVGEWFMHDVHVANKQEEARTDAQYRHQFGRFEAILATLTADFFTPMAKLDAVLADPQASVEDALVHVAHDQHVRYLFETLDRADWIRDLNKKGFFRTPPSSVLEDGGQFIRFPVWPALRFLVRVASRRPDEVLAIAKTIPSTENISVLADLLDMAVRLPPRHAAALATQLLRLLGGDEQFHTLVEHRLEPLVGHLAKGKQVDAAEATLCVAAKTLAPKTSYGAPAPRMPMWSYERLFSSNLDALIAADAERFFNRFILLLRGTVRSGLTKAEIAAGQDASAGWRQDVASTSGRADDPRDVLVDMVRETALRIAVTTEGFTRVVAQLEEERFSVFMRIALHVVLERRALVPLEAARFVTQSALFDSYEVRCEYARLLSGAYADLASDQQAVVLGWIEQGPDLSYVDEAYVGGDGQPSLTELKRERQEGWQTEKLALIAHALDGEWADKYRRLLDEHGAPDDPRVPAAHGVWVGPTSPFDANELKELEVGALVAKLQAWVPAKGWMVPTPSGVARQVAELVAGAPEKFTETGRFTVLEPTYVRSIVDGFQGAVTVGRDVPWESALGLIEWVLRQPFENVGGDGLDRDVGFRRTRSSAARLISDALGRKVLPFALRKRVWLCIERLLGDPDPTREEEDARIGRGTDARNLSLSTTRSVTLDAAMRYGVWTREGLGETAVTGLGPMPELQSALERHLHPDLEASRAVRWVYGIWFTYLLSLDPSWVAAHVNDVFGAPENTGDLGATAWDAFVSTTAPGRREYEVLGAHYARAVERLGKGPRTAMRVHSPDQALAHHLARLYWSEVIELVTPGSPVRRFYEVASLSLRTELVDFIGRALYATKESELPAVVAERLRGFWAARVRSLETVPAAERDVELAAFGWWFAAGNLGAEWLLEQLRAALRLNPRVEPSMFVLERLATFATNHTDAALACLELLVQSDNILWSIDSWKKNAWIVLSSAFANASSNGRARELVNELGRRGFQEYRSLLGGGNPGT